MERGGRRFGACLYRGGNSLCEGRRDRYACLAARFAAKEAVFKALVTVWPDAAGLMGGLPDREAGPRSYCTGSRKAGQRERHRVCIDQPVPQP